ncbi:MAG: alcohol dehydrogenase catalytic domain-containing protein, partial [Armatimonadetes bacterium]|nr:alcohol dehydrogenase catalytic domain-containing protein [Armatimonadota bacterium]
MLAAVFAGPGRLEMRDVAEPSCPDGGSLIAIDACAVCGTDVRIVTHGHHKVRPPQVLGHELVGRVLAGELAG